MATLQELLAEARQALHALVTGRAVVRFRDETGAEVQYGQANRGALEAYITKLENTAAGRSFAPMRVVF